MPAGECDPSQQFYRSMHLLEQMGMVKRFPLFMTAQARF